MLMPAPVTREIHLDPRCNDPHLWAYQGGIEQFFKGFHYTVHTYREETRLSFNGPTRFMVKQRQIEQPMESWREVIDDWGVIGVWWYKSKENRVNQDLIGELNPSEFAKPFQDLLTVYIRAVLVPESGLYSDEHVEPCLALDIENRQAPANARVALSAAVSFGNYMQCGITGEFGERSTFGNYSVILSDMRNILFPSRNQRGVKFTVYDDDGHRVNLYAGEVIFLRPSNIDNYLWVFKNGRRIFSNLRRDRQFTHMHDLIQRIISAQNDLARKVETANAHPILQSESTTLAVASDLKASIVNLKRHLDAIETTCDSTTQLIAELKQQYGREVESFALKHREDRDLVRLLENL
jgi:hypothetical protein